MTGEAGASSINPPEKAPPIHRRRTDRTVRKWEAADTILAASAALIVGIFAILGALAWQSYGTNVSEAHERAQRGADLVASETEWLIGSGLVVLDQIAFDIAGNVGNVTSAARSDIEQALARLPAEMTLGIYSAAGSVEPGGASPSLPASIASADYFQAIVAGADWTISAQQTDAASGAPIFVIAKRLGEPLEGVAALTVQGDILSTFWSLQNLGPNSTLSLIREDGLVIARHPALETPLTLEGPVLERLASQPWGTYASHTSPADGVSRVVGFRHVPEFGVVALASVSHAQILERLWYGLIIVSLLLAPIALGLLAGSFMTARLLRQGDRTRRHLEAAVAHNEVLFREIHHRVKNNLQSVAALLQLQPIPKEIKFEMGQRIAAMSAVHEHIYRTNSFSTVRVKDYLRILIQNIRDGHNPAISVVEQIDDLAVDKDTATPLGLLLNEVVTNAFKHAFPGDRAGVITVTLTRNDDGAGCLIVEDNGVGFDPLQPSKGIGRRLIGALTKQIDGTATFSGDGGGRFLLTFPLATG